MLHPDAAKEGDSPCVLLLHQDLEQFVNTAYVACQKQCEQLGITDEQFGEMLDDAAFTELRAAFFQEWEDFFGRAGVTGQAAALRKQRELLKIAGSRIDQLPMEMFMKEVDQAIESLTGGDSSTSSQG